MKSKPKDKNYHKHVNATELSKLVHKLKQCFPKCPPLHSSVHGNNFTLLCTGILMSIETFFLIVIHSTFKRYLLTVLNKF